MRQTGQANSAMAFSLVEVMVVLVLLGLMAVGTVTVYRVKARSAGMDDVLGRLALIDAQARQTAQRSGQTVTIQFDLSASRIVLEDPSAQTERTPYRLPSTLWIDQIALKENSVTSGQLVIPVTAQGLSQSYALLLRDENGTYATNLVAGLTGQIARYDGENGWSHARATVSSLDID